MYAVSASAARTDGRTSFDSVASFAFGNFTPKLTANGQNPNPNPKPITWCADRSVRDRHSYRPLATGHGHRP